MIIDLIVFVSVISAALLFDFKQHKQAKEISVQEAIHWVLFYIALSVSFAIFIYASMGANASILFLTGWGLEKVLAVDNLVVFAAIFSYFKIEDKYQHKILYLGIIGAIVLRLIFVTIGIGVSHAFSNLSNVLFGCVILYTAWLMYSADENDDVDYNNAWYITAVKKWLPVTYQRKRGQLFINGKATAFFFALVAIEFSDIIFAFDSVPAIISVTKDPFLVYSAMMFAILGLRSMYFVLSALQRNFEYFETAVIFVLIFIAFKLFANTFVGYELSPIASLFSVVMILGSGVGFSLLKEKQSEI